MTTPGDVAAGFLAGRWHAMKDGAGPESMARILGMIEMAMALGALTQDQAELWERRVQTCPGHQNEGGRVWCAFCGTLKQPKPEPPEETDE